MRREGRGKRKRKEKRKKKKNHRNIVWLHQSTPTKYTSQNITKYTSQNVTLHQTREARISLMSMQVPAHCRTPQARVWELPKDFLSSLEE
jgi:hypothetical protein